MDVCIGMIGCGGIAQGKHMPGLQKAGAELRGFFDVDRVRAEACAAKFGKNAVVFDSVEALLADERITTVQICTPNLTHASYAVQALNAGKNVMCEKPMAINAAEAEKMVEAAKQNHRKLTIAYQGRFRREAQLLKSMCEEGELGEIYFARAHALRRRGVPNWGVYRGSRLQGGGCLIDIGTHALDLTLWLMNNYEPESVLASTYRKIVDRPTDANVWGEWESALADREDAAFAMIRMKNGATVELECSWAINCREAYENCATLAGTKAGADLRGGLWLNGANRGSLYLNHVDVFNETGTSFPVSHADEPGDAEMAAWAEAIRDDREPLVKPEQALTVARLIDAIYLSAREGREVRIADM